MESDCFAQVLRCQPILDPFSKSGGHFIDERLPTKPDQDFQKQWHVTVTLLYQNCRVGAVRVMTVSSFFLVSSYFHSYSMYFHSMVMSLATFPFVKNQET